MAGSPSTSPSRARKSRSRRPRAPYGVNVRAFPRTKDVPRRPRLEHERVPAPTVATSSTRRKRRKPPDSSPARHARTYILSSFCKDVLKRRQFVCEIPVDVGTTIVEDSDFVWQREPAAQDIFTVDRHIAALTIREFPNAGVGRDKNQIPCHPNSLYLIFRKAQAHDVPGGRQCRLSKKPFLTQRMPRRRRLTLQVPTKVDQHLLDYRHSCLGQAPCPRSCRLLLPRPRLSRLILPPQGFIEIRHRQRLVDAAALFGATA